MPTTTIDQSKISYVSDAQGKPSAVIVPIDVWERIRAEIGIEADWPGPVMRQRILDSINSNERIPFDEAIKRLGMTREDFDAGH